jgi:hypothetical protein
MLIITGVLFAALMFLAVRLGTLDSRLDQYRVGAADASRGIAPFRWRRKFYRREADPLLGQIWMTLSAFYVVGALTLILSYFAFDMGGARTPAG